MSFVLVWISFAAVSFGALSLASTGDCQSALSSSAQQLGLVQWRQANTHTLGGTSYSATDLSREWKLQQFQQAMEQFIVQDHDVPEMEFVAEAGVKVKVLRHWKNNEIPAIEVGGLGTEGKLRGSILLPVSGHVGLENARNWAKTDTYSLLLEEEGLSAQPLIKDAKSLDMITLHELEIPLKKGKRFRLTYHRSGSGGPGGFPEGRTLDLYWDGT